MNSSPLSGSSISRPSQSPNREKLLHLLLIACFAALFYSNSFGNFFVWNDWTLIIENFLIKDWRNLPEIFASAFWKPLLGESPQIYRPLVLASFMADFALWGLKPWGYHLTNICLHVLNSFLAYFLIRAYVSSAIALMGSLLFAVHPVQTEAVTYIYGRGELLQSVFLLSGALLFLASGKRSSRALYLASLPVFFLALLSKEAAVIFPLWLLVADLTAVESPRSGGLSRLWSRQIGPLLTVALYIVLRCYYEGINLFTHDWPVAGVWQAFHGTVRAVFLYVGFLLFPWNLHFLHPNPAPLVHDATFLLSLFLLACAGWLASFGWKRESRAMTFGILWLFIGFLPLLYSGALALPVLEGRVYLPSIGFFLLAALCLSRLENVSSSRLHIWLFLLISVALGGLTFYRNLDWKDDMKIAAHTLDASPGDPTAMRLFGDAVFRRGRIQEGEEIFKKALGLESPSARLHESLGRLYSFVGKDREALEQYQRMRELTSKEPYAYWRLGRFHWRRKNFAEAEGYLEKATHLFPYSSELHNDLAGVYFLQGKLDRARAELEAGLKILPHSTVLRSNLEQVLKKGE